MLGACAGATAQPKTYDVEHEFEIRTAGNIAPEVRHVFYIDTYARTDRVKDDPDREKGEHVIGFGLHTDTQNAGPVPSHAEANSQANITTLDPGHVAGEVAVFGEAEAVLGRRSAYAESYAYSKVRAKGQHEDRRGRIRFKGRWKASKAVDGSARDSKIVVRDPVIARLTDHTTGEIKEWTLITVKSETLGGEFEWDNDVVRTDADEVLFSLELPGQITPESGRLRVVVEGGVVIESVATGDFAGVAVPPVGSATGFSFALANDMSVAYDMGGDPTHDLEPELLFDNASHAADESAAWDNGGWLTDLGIGLDLANVSQVRGAASTLGVPMMGELSVADDFAVEEGTQELDLLAVPVVQPSGVLVHGAYVRLWDGNPALGGIPIAGDLVTNRLLGVRDLGAYRMHEDDDPTRSDMPMSELEIDMSWAPPLEEGRYWLELRAEGGEVLAIPPVNRSGDENALTTDPAGPTWVPLFDLATGDALDLSWTLFFADGGCYADCDGNTRLDVFDFLCFQDAFVSGDPYADCDGNGAMDVFDFLCFQDAFVTGCP
jgi:hypothetical protein